jgi:DNA-binding NtrC family response regulator
MGETLGTAGKPHRSTPMTFDNPKEVLVVEDEPLVRMVAADALADEGIMAWEAADAEEALHVLEKRPRIGLVFTDVDMPGDMNGLGLAHEVSVRRPDVSLIVTSGAVTVREEDLPDHGSFLPKPYPTEHLVSIVARKLDTEN